MLLTIDLCTVLLHCTSDPSIPEIHKPNRKVCGKTYSTVTITPIIQSQDTVIAEYSQPWSSPKASRIHHQRLTLGLLLNLSQSQHLSLREGYVHIPYTVSHLFPRQSKLVKSSHLASIHPVRPVWTLLQSDRLRFPYHWKYRPLSQTGGLEFYSLRDARRTLLDLSLRPSTSRFV